MSLEDLTNKVREAAKSKDALGKTIKFDIDGEYLTLDGTGDANVVTNENSDADCTVKVGKENFGKMLDGSMNPMTAFMTGKIKIEGDMSVAMKLQGLF